MVVVVEMMWVLAVKGDGGASRVCGGGYGGDGGGGVGGIRGGVGVLQRRRRRRQNQPIMKGSFILSIKHFMSCST